MKPPIAPILAAPCITMLLLTLSPSSAAEDHVLVRNKDVAVTDADFKAYMERVPPELRFEAQADSDRNSKVVDILFTNRMLAKGARAAGLDKDPVLERRIAQLVEAFLAQQYTQYLEKSAAIPANLEARAKEVYLTEPARFTVPARVELEHILVDLNGRTKEMALARANEIRAKALAGEDFLKLAETYSNDPGYKRNFGKLGFVSDKDIDQRLAAVAFAMKSNGEISEPIETQYGYHLIRRTGFAPSYKRSYESVKAEIIEDEQSKIRNAAVAKAIESYRRSPDTKWDGNAVGALRTVIPQAELNQAHREAAEKLKRETQEPATTQADQARRAPALGPGSKN